MVTVQVDNFNLPATVESGQIFRLRRYGEGYVITHGDQHFQVQQQGKNLHFTGTSRKFLNAFFRLDEHHSEVLRHLGKDPLLNPAIAEHYGLRLIRQDPRECSVAFLCSQMSNVKRIAQNLHTLAAQFGVPQQHALGAFYPFPHPTTMTDARRIAKAKLGYRAAYLRKAAPHFTDVFFDELRELPYAEAKQRLMEVPGIGEKVADCILLYSLEKMEAFPVDVWVKRVMEELCFDGKPTSEKHIREFATTRWGNDAGYAQQYLFHWRRMLGKEVVSKSSGEERPSPAPGWRRGWEGGRREPKEAVILV